jgi:sulfur-oxidizing protein SoxY
MKRRNFIKGFCATSAMVATMSPSLLMAKGEKTKGGNILSYAAAVEAITGGKVASESDKVNLIVPEIAENGAVVPVKVEVDNPMEENNYVKAIHVLATKNGNARCADVMLTPLNGRGYFATRVKLGETQDIVALVELSNGTFMKSVKSVKVTIGGCG